MFYSFNKKRQNISIFEEHQSFEEKNPLSDCMFESADSLQKSVVLVLTISAI